MDAVAKGYFVGIMMMMVAPFLAIGGMGFMVWRILRKQNPAAPGGKVPGT